MAIEGHQSIQVFVFQMSLCKIGGVCDYTSKVNRVKHAQNNSTTPGQRYHLGRFKKKEVRAVERYVTARYDMAVLYSKIGLWKGICG